MADVVALPTRPRLAVAGDGQPPIAERLAWMLSEICNAPLITLPSHQELRLEQFNPELAGRAAALLEEAGW